MMAIEKSNSYSKGGRFDPDFSSPNSRESMSSDDDDDDGIDDEVEVDVEAQRRSGVVSGNDSDDVNDEDGIDDEDEDDDEFYDADSGAGSDDFDLLELGETGVEFCQIGNSTCSVPYELYDLSGLEDILSVDVWNDVLTDEERFSLTKFLPDLDQYNFANTLKELFEGQNFHFGSPTKKLFEMLKGGLCEPRVALYREGLNFFQKRQHYHLLRQHHNNMVANFCQMRDAWYSCRGYSIEEKLRVLNIMKSQKSLMYEKIEEHLESDSSEKEEFANGARSKKTKERKSLLLGNNAACAVGVNSEFPSPIPSIGLGVSNYGRQNPKGMLKLSGSKEMTGRIAPVYQGLDTNSRPYQGFPVAASRQKAVGYDSLAALRPRDHLRANYDEDDDAAYKLGLGIQRGQNVPYSGLMQNSGVMKSGNMRDIMRREGLGSDAFMGFPMAAKNDLHAYRKSRNVNQLSEVTRAMTKPPSVRTSQHFGNKKFPENIYQFDVTDQMKLPKHRAPQPGLKGNRADFSEHGESTWHAQNQGFVYPMGSSLHPDDFNMRSKKWKTGRESPDLYFKDYGSSSPQVNDRMLLSKLRAKELRGKIRENLVRNGRLHRAANKSNRRYVKKADTDSDSSEQSDDDDNEDVSLLMRSTPYSSDTVEGSCSLLLRSGIDPKKGKFFKKDMQASAQGYDAGPDFSRLVPGFNELADMPEYSSKVQQKSKIRGSSPFRSTDGRVVDNISAFVLDNAEDENDRRRSRKLGRNGKLRGSAETLYVSSLKPYPSDQKQQGQFSRDYAIGEENDLLETRLLADENTAPRFGKKGHGSEVYVHGRRQKSEAAYPGFNSSGKKRKAYEEIIDFDVRDEDGTMQQSSIQGYTDDSYSLKKKGKRKAEIDAGPSDMVPCEPLITENVAVEMEPEPKPQKKPYTPITPTVHTGFSFSIIHLFSAIRLAMISPLPEDSLEVAKSNEDQKGKQGGDADGLTSNGNTDANKLDHSVQPNVPSLTIQEIVNRVRSNPGDPCILETQEPLQDLVRGVLKIFSSKTAPLGAKGWKALVSYEKSTKSWTWIGPVSQTSTDHETIEEVTSPEYWGLPHKMLVKLVDSFANWLKSGQETLQQIGSLPAPPLSLMQCNLDEKERFKDLRAQKSLNTISPSSEEVREYFRKEEVLRYSIPDRAFQYTAADGKKSIVAPLRRCGGKPTSKARDHFMLKRDRPPHVTILCLVRDAASRLPGSIGTRADVCTLIRDSQYIVEDVSDAQVNQVVSGALDRLHYERDPCVQFDGERKLWVYLHRDREEEDFEDDGTSSTKKWKRQKKDPAEQQDQPDQGAVTVAFHSTDQSGPGLDSDLNSELPPAGEDVQMNPVSNDLQQTVEDNAVTGPVSDQVNAHQASPMDWEADNLNSLQENKLLCQENSKNEAFDGETFGRERSVGLLSASLS